MSKRKQKCSMQELTDQLYPKSLPFRSKPLKSPSIPKATTKRFHFDPVEEQSTRCQSPIESVSSSDITNEEDWIVVDECSDSVSGENQMSEDLAESGDDEWEPDDSVEQMRTTAFSESDYCVDQIVAATSRILDTFDSDDFNDNRFDPVAFSTPTEPTEAHVKNPTFNVEGSDNFLERNLPKASSTLLRNAEAEAEPNYSDFYSLADPTISSIQAGFPRASVKDLHSISVEELPEIPEISFVNAFDEDDDTLKDLENHLRSVASEDIRQLDPLDLSPQKVTLSRSEINKHILQTNIQSAQNIFLEEENGSCQSHSSHSTVNYYQEDGLDPSRSSKITASIQTSCELVSGTTTSHQAGTLDAFQNSQTDAASRHGRTFLTDGDSSQSISSINNQTNKSFESQEKACTASKSSKKRREDEPKLQRGRKHLETVSRSVGGERRERGSKTVSASLPLRAMTPILRDDVPVDDIMFVVYGPNYMDSVMSQTAK